MSIQTNDVVKRNDYTVEVMNLLDQLYEKFFPNGDTYIGSLISDTKSILLDLNCNQAVPSNTCDILAEMYDTVPNIQQVQGAQSPRQPSLHYDDKAGFQFYDVVLKASEIAEIKGLAATYLTGEAPCDSDGSCPGYSSPCDTDQPDCDSYVCDVFNYNYPPGGSFHFWCFQFSCSNTFHIYSGDSEGQCTIFDLPQGCDGTYEWIHSTPSCCG